MDADPRLRRDCGVRGRFVSHLLRGYLYQFIKGCYSRLPKIGWLKKEIYFLTVLQGRSLRSKCPQGLFLLRAGREEAAPSLSSWLADDIFYLCFHIIFPVYVFLFKFPFIKTPVLLN